MVEPRSLMKAPDIWLTDSRVYNLIWLGRWLERAEVISRAVNSAARSVTANDAQGMAQGVTQEIALAEALAAVANRFGLSVENPEHLAAEMLLRSQVSSVMHCLSSARLNATQVAPVELIRAIGDAILELEEVDDNTLQNAERVIQVTQSIAARMAEIYATIEDRWFGSESLTEEEVFHRFVQQ